MTDWTVIVIGNNHCWGKGSTVSEARKLASRPAKYSAYLCHPDTRVCEISGGLFYPKGEAPILVERVNSVGRRRNAAQ
jgi:hypothetical protein